MIEVKFIIIFVSLLYAGASLADAAIVERIKKIGDVCIEGDNCRVAPVIGSADVTESMAVDDCVEGKNCNVAPFVAVVVGGSSIEENYKKSCATCHVAGVAGAPKLGDSADWEPRIAKGMDRLYNSVINGLPPAMPAKGMCFSCSDDELRSIVDYMVESLK